MTQQGFLDMEVDVEVTIAEYARIREVTRQTIHEHVQKGNITLTKNGGIIPAEGDKELEEKVGVDQRYKMKNGDTDEGLGSGDDVDLDEIGDSDISRLSFKEAKTLLAVTKARDAKIDLDKKLGTLADVKGFNKAAFEAARSLRDKGLRIPDRVSEGFAVEQDAAVIHAMLTKEIKKVFLLELIKEVE